MISGPRQRQDVVVALEVAPVSAKALAAEAALVQLVLLDHRAHRAVEQHDALFEQPFRRSMRSCRSVSSAGAMPNGAAARAWTRHRPRLRVKAGRPRA